ncbi:hypothetical protein BN8_03223 [Fibrisoma limi BUZ 3]|uniref:Uncharacterized protein n=1 Tax=Fibrisoma limi BUZ 3 TaxID=1185876 RepID=I2GJK6_9BACT|nr:hypothetical protein BN8_03223 [Fibrisoma limi BUZ 3]
MENNNQHLKRLFEEYIYTIIAKYIDVVDGPTQTRLVNLYSQLHNQLHPETPRLITSPDLTGQTSVNRENHAELIQGLLLHYQNQIVNIMAHIQRMDQLIERAKGSSQKPLHSSILNHYQLVRENFVISLKKTQLLCQCELFRPTT